MRMVRHRRVPRADVARASRPRPSEVGRPRDSGRDARATIFMAVAHARRLTGTQKP